jgi:predicted enzyme related to lactoylglutathione lyase
MEGDVTGKIVWHELLTDDLGIATRFYNELLDAKIETAAMDGYEYQMLKKGEGNHAGFVQKDEATAQVRSHWYPYVHVEDVDDSVAKARELGAQLIHGPAEVGDMLRFAVLGDPQHATFGVMTSDGEGPKGVFAWDELHATEPDAAASFYGGLFGWATAPFVEEYRVFRLAESGVGGLMQERGGSQAANWLAYFAVEDTDAAAARAMELGAGVIVPPESMQDVGRYAVLTDPTGAAFGLHNRSTGS